MKQVLMMAGFVCLPVVMTGWQEMVGGLAIRSTEIRTSVDRATRDYAEMPLTMPWINQQARQAAKAMSDEQRAAAVREIGAAVKAMVMSKAFQEAHDAYLKQNHKAVNHGIKAGDAETLARRAGAGDTSAADEAMKQAAAQMGNTITQLPVEALKEMFASDLENWAESAKSETGEEKVKMQKLAARAKALEPLLKSDPEKFKQGYGVLKSIELGGPDSMEALSASGDKAAREAEQYAWNQRNLRVVLKKKLGEFIATASSVDFTAQTTQQGRLAKFTNPAYERKGDVWKACYRAGRPATMAALEFAKAWSKEL